MNLRLGVLAAAGCLLLANASADAHHAIGSTVDTGKRAEYDAVLRHVDWINPHSWFHFDVTMAGGKVVKDVKLETLSIPQMQQAGYSDASAFAVGKSYKITFYPNRDGSPGGYLLQLAQDDGKVLVLRRG